MCPNIDAIGGLVDSQVDRPQAIFKTEAAIGCNLPCLFLNSAFEQIVILLKP